MMDLSGPRHVKVDPVARRALVGGVATLADRDIAPNASRRAWAVAHPTSEAARPTQPLTAVQAVRVGGEPGQALAGRRWKVQAGHRALDHSRSLRLASW